MVGRVAALAEVAQARGVKLMVDAEHTYFQPAIDHTARSLARTYNRDAPVIFNTYQVCWLVVVFFGGGGLWVEVPFITLTRADTYFFN
jgi:hypothetical protein